MATRLTGKTVAIVGDSQQVGSFGRSLVKALEAAGARVVEDSRVGRATGHLYKDGIKELEQCAGFCLKGTAVLKRLAAERPDVFIIRLSGNDAAAIGVNDAKHRDNFARLRQSALDMGAKEIWLIAGYAYADPKLQAGQMSVTRGAGPLFGPYFIDLYDDTKNILTPEAGRAADLIHFTKRGTDKFAGKVARRIIEGHAGGSRLGGFPVMPVLAAVAALGLGFVLWRRFSSRSLPDAPVRLPLP